MIPLRTLVADDNPDFLASLVHWLNLQTGLQVVGCAASGHSTLEQTKKLNPDILLMDATLPGMNAADVIRQVKAHTPGVRVILLALDDQPDYHTAAQRAGADGLLDKAKFAEQIYPLLEQLFPFPSQSGKRIDRRRMRSQVSGLTYGEKRHDH